ncbi:MAG TPA: DsrE family protein [Actinomycetota bacterium]
MSQKMLIVVNDPPYGSERSYNALRLAGSLSKCDDVDLRVFLIGDAVGCAVADQKVPDGYYHLDRIIGSVGRHGGDVGCCGTCLDARGIPGDRLANGARRSSLEELTAWTVWADKVVAF